MKHATKQEMAEVARELVQPILDEYAGVIADFRAELIRQEKLIRTMAAELQGLKTRVSIADRKMEAVADSVLKYAQRLENG